MPLKKSVGNMYDWVTHTWNCIIGECPNQCSYCYVQNTPRTRHLPTIHGTARFNPRDKNINLGKGKTIFVCHTNDLFAVSPTLMLQVLSMCKKYPDNKYVFQSKAPSMILKYKDCIPFGSVIGTTIESDNGYLLCNNIYKGTLLFQESIERPITRSCAMRLLKESGFKTFITIEPIMQFSPALVGLIANAKPDWVNIGADSKRCNLPEPTWGEVQDLIKALKDRGVVIREKTNLERLKKNG